VADGARTIVMVHGAFAGAWCFDRLRGCIRRTRLDVRRDRPPPPRRREGRRRRLAAGEHRRVPAGAVDHLRAYATPPIVLGHSMGAVLAQQAAALGLVARSCSSVPRRARACCRRRTASAPPPRD
jgi:pimeloyl-ACP methyl ester carboxylesterase